MYLSIVLHQCRFICSVVRPQRKMPPSSPSASTRWERWCLPLTTRSGGVTHPMIRIMANKIVSLSLWYSFSLRIKVNGCVICWHVFSDGWWLVFFYQGTCYIWTLSGGRGTDPVKVHLKKTFEAHSKYGIKCLFSPDSTYVFYFYSSSMH